MIVSMSYIRLILYCAREICPYPRSYQITFHERTEICVVIVIIALIILLLLFDFISFFLENYEPIFGLIAFLFVCSI